MTPPRIKFSTHNSSMPHTSSLLPFCFSNLLQYPGEVDPSGFEIGVNDKRGKATFGHATGTLKPKPDHYLKKHEKEPVLPARTSCHHHPSHSPPSGFFAFFFFCQKCRIFSFL